MERQLYALLQGLTLALNRTIVGWKDGRWVELMVFGPALNRTIVGWKVKLDLQLGVGEHALNRTIVGWKAMRGGPSLRGPAPL